MISETIKRIPLIRKWRRIRAKITGIPRHPLQDRANIGGFKICSLGSEYGCWSFVEGEDLHGCTIISAGLGEDASFDVEFANKFDAKVILIDPTPRAIEHYNAIAENFGGARTQGYVKGGNQPIEAYDLASISADKFKLVARALWNAKGTLRFFQPTNPHHVSHSIVNYQNSYSRNTNFMEVESVTISDVLEGLDVNPSDIPLMKLDIEGAEIEVLTDCMERGFNPRQILVEFDELLAPSERGFERVTFVDTLLGENGYQMVWSDGLANFLYLKDAT